jgi:hypothetical protein
MNKPAILGNKMKIGLQATKDESAVGKNTCLLSWWNYRVLAESGFL